MPPKSRNIFLNVYLDGCQVAGTDAAFKLMQEVTPLAVRPIGDLHSVPHFRCGFCKKAIVLFKDDKHPERCRWCGLPIDWGDF